MRKRGTFNSRAATPDSAPTARDIDFVRALGKGKKISIGQLRVAQIVEARGLARGRSDGTWVPTKKGLALLAAPTPVQATRKPSATGYMLLSSSFTTTVNGRRVTKNVRVERDLVDGQWVDRPASAPATPVANLVKSITKKGNA